jgi:hypothetical protein
MAKALCKTDDTETDGLISKTSGGRPVRQRVALAAPSLAYFLAFLRPE